MNELQIHEEQLEVVQGSIKFPEYEQIKKSAEQLAENLKSVQVTEDTLKTSKKLLAEVNKQVSALDDRRKQIKKQMLAPYSEFESQVKEITSIVKDASATVREQEKVLEEKYRKDKQSVLIDIYNKRTKAYNGFPFTFDVFLEQNSNVLNKSMSINKCEELIASWINDKNNDLEAIKTYPDNELLYGAYLTDPISLNNAIKSAAQIKESVEKARQVNKEYEAFEETSFDDYEEDETVTKVFKITSTDAEIEYIKAVLNNKNIEYKLI
ncbi:DUF1351 domain-containing protein [Lactobacillus terrae]|uniref:DUF1351 domain-containing protein n=1 Tax=Lactobacillus terrae TaxID=2269374 RepID=UPI000C1B725D|nr:DUF1351 domain-containing protein [Lactobacillus terrae]